MEIFVTLLLVWWVTHAARGLARAVPGPGTLLRAPSVSSSLGAGVVHSPRAGSSRTELVAQQSLFRQVHSYFTMAQLHSELIHFINRQAWCSCHCAVLTGLRFTLGSCWSWRCWLTEWALLYTRRVPCFNCCQSDPGRDCLAGPSRDLQLSNHGHQDNITANRTNFANRSW